MPGLGTGCVWDWVCVAASGSWHSFTMHTAHEYMTSYPGNLGGQMLGGHDCKCSIDTCVATIAPKTCSPEAIRHQTDLHFPGSWRLPSVMLPDVGTAKPQAILHFTVILHTSGGQNFTTQPITMSCTSRGWQHSCSYKSIQPMKSSSDNHLSSAHTASNCCSTASCYPTHATG